MHQYCTRFLWHEGLSKVPNTKSLVCLITFVIKRGVLGVRFKIHNHNYALLFNTAPSSSTREQRSKSRYLLRPNVWYCLWLHRIFPREWPWLHVEKRFFLSITQQQRPKIPNRSLVAWHSNYMIFYEHNQDSQSVRHPTKKGVPLCLGCFHDSQQWSLSTI